MAAAGLLFFLAPPVKQHFIALTPVLAALFPMFLRTGESDGGVKKKGYGCSA